jgi:hypothetical protein
MIPRIRQQLKRLKRTRDKMKILHLGHIKAIARKFIDDTVAIQENDFHIQTGGLQTRPYALFG